MFYFSWVFVGWKERVWGKLTASLQAPWRSWPIKWNPIFSLSWICEKYEKDARLLSRQNVPVFLFRIGFHVVKLNSLISSVLVTIDSLMQTNSSPGKTMLEKPQCNSDVPSDKQPESCSVVSDSLWAHELYSPWNSPGQNAGVSSCCLLQGIFPTQGSNPGALHCRWILHIWTTRETQIVVHDC